MRVPTALLMIAAMTQAVAAEPVDTLMSAERDFAARSLRLGVKAAFLGVLAEDALLFRPGPVNGRDWYAARPDVAPFTLAWAPEAGEASADLGYTYGPYRLTPRDAEGRDGDALGGHYFSVWTREAGASWRLWLDQGVPHALTELPVEAATPASPRPSTGGRAEDLAARDDAFNTLLAGAHDAAAVQPYLSTDAVLLRPGQLPQSRDAVAAWTPMRAPAQRSALRVSKDGRLAATAGAAPGTQPQTYQRAWRLEADGWRVVVDLVGD